MTVGGKKGVGRVRVWGGREIWRGKTWQGSKEEEVDGDKLDLVDFLFLCETSVRHNFIPVRTATPAQSGRFGLSSSSTGGESPSNLSSSAASPSRTSIGALISVLPLIIHKRLIISIALVNMRSAGRVLGRSIHRSGGNGGPVSARLVSHHRLSFLSSAVTTADCLRNHRTAISGPASSGSPFLPERWNFFAVQRRNMFIQTQSTPNPMSLMFYPGKPVMEVGSADFPNARTAMGSPLAKALFGIDGITRVFYGSEFVTVTKSDDASWDFLKPEIFASIMDFYSSGQSLFLDSKTAAAMDTAIQEDDSETVAMIKELLETRIRPAVQDDGGDIEYRRFDPDTGIVKLKMHGACSGCPSSSVTLKSGIENMLMHYVPEVKGVEQEVDEDEEPSLTNQME